MGAMWSRLIPAALLVLPTFGQVTLVVDPGDVARPPVCPVTVTLAMDQVQGLAPNSSDHWKGTLKSAGQERAVQARTVRDAEGRPVGVELAWFEVDLEPGEVGERELTLVPRDGRSQGSFVFALEDGSSVMKKGGEAVWRHMTAWAPERHDDTFRPYTHLYGAGELCLTKGPDGLYPHHRGVFCGWTRTQVGDQTYNFWAIPKDNRPHQEHAEWVSGRGWLGSNLARVCARAEWKTPEGEVVVEELREWDTWRYDAAPGSPHVLLDYRITLIAHADEPIHLQGDPAHAGFQVRLAQSVAQAQACTYTFPEGTTGGQGDNWQNAAWVAAGFPIAERSFEVLFHDHPDNPDPTWNTRNYGRFGPFFQHTLEPGERIELRYALRIRERQPEHPEHEQLDAAAEHASWMTPVKVRVK